MQSVILTIVFFIVIGGVGMYFGNRKVERSVAKQRWLKYVAYILITSIIVLSIWYHFFYMLATLIVLVGYFELLKAFYFSRRKWLVLVVYSIIAAGFCVFAFNIIKQFQFFIYLQILAFDAFSQVVGQLIGKTQLASKISPTKTTEGLIGGIFFSMLSAVLLSNWMNISNVAAILFGLFTAIAGFVGDLLASYSKRIASIKDYSNLLPGQGGFLDRFDSFMMASLWYSIVYLIVRNLSFAF